jgi:hypothetical protein
MKSVNLSFNYPEDEGLNLTGTVSFADAIGITIDTLTIRGLAAWRHAPSNVIHANEATIENLHLVEKSQALSKVGLNWIGIKANNNLLLSFAVRSGRNGTKKVQEQLTKFFKALGASKIAFNVIDPENFDSDGDPNDDSNDSD